MKEYCKPFVESEKVALFGDTRRLRLAEKRFNETGRSFYYIDPDFTTDAAKNYYSSYAETPKDADVAILDGKSEQVLEYLKQCKEAGLRKVWINFMSENDDIIKFCQENDLEMVRGHCINMYIGVKGISHAVHRFFARLFGKY